jgi:CHAT domain-containing protein
MIFVCAYSNAQSNNNASEFNIPFHAEQVKDSLIRCSDLTSKEDLCSMIALCSYSGIRFSKHDKHTIERHIKSFTANIENNDTMQFYYETMLKIAFYEFVQKDYAKAISAISTYDTYAKVITVSALSFSRFEFSKWRLESKRNLKPNGNERSWVETNHSQIRNDNVTFLNGLLSDIPMSFDIQAYSLIMSIVYDEDNVTGDKELCNQFINRAIRSGRNDIVKCYLLLNPPAPGLQNNLTRLGLYCAAKQHGNQEFIREYSSLLTHRSKTDIALDSVEQLASKINPIQLLYNYGRIYNNYDDNALNLVSCIFGNTSEEYKEVTEHLWKTSALNKLTMPDEELKQRINEDINTNGPTVSENIITLFNRLYGQYLYSDLLSLVDSYEPHIVSNYKTNFYNLIALSECNLGLYQQGIEHYQLALQYTNNPATIRTLHLNMGFAYTEMGLYDTAKDIYDLYASIQDKDIDNFIYNDYLGRLYSFTDRDKALQYFAIAESYMDNTILYSDKKSRHYSWLSHVTPNKYLQRECLDKSIKLDTEKWFGGIDTIPAGVDFAELGWFYTTNYDYEKADSYYHRAYTYLKKLTPEDKRRTSLDTYYACNLMGLRQYALAIDVLNNLADLQLNVLGRKHIEYLRTVRLLLQAYITQGDLIGSNNLYQQYISLLEFHPEEVESNDDLLIKTDYLLIKGDNHQIISMLSHIIEENDDVDNIELIIRYAKALMAENPTKLIDKIDLITSKCKSLIASTFVKLSEVDRIAWQKPLSELQNIFIKASEHNIHASKGIIEYNLFTKGLLFHTSAAINKRLLQNKKTRLMVGKMQNTTDSLNLAFSVGDTLQIQRLTSKISSAERQLSNANVSSKVLRKMLDVDIRQIIKAIGKRGLAIDFVRYNSNDTFRYGAFIFSQNLKQPHFVQICDEATLLSQVQKSDGSINAIFYRDKGNKGSSYNLIWGKLVKYFDGYDDIYFSGDGILNQIPIELLPNEDDVQTCDLYKIHRVFHLADIRKPLTIGDNFMAVGVSNYNTPIGNEDVTDRGGWGDLKAVLIEFESVKTQFKPYSDQYSTKYVLNDEAREIYVKSLNNEPITTLHLSTHGFYKDRKTLERADELLLDIDHNIAHRALIAGKESLSGLILRNGNISWKSAEVTDADDDILTSDEIENLTFPKLNLTVLSACETGLGDVDSEGVWGLQRAFRIAGTQSLICSLCKINDEWTAQFMNVFYQNAASGKSIYDSFQAARIYLYENTKTKTPKNDHMPIWASMILIE